MSLSDYDIEITSIHPDHHLDENRILRLIVDICNGERARLLELSLVLADHQTVRELNQSYLNHDYDTDVLSFPLNAPEESGVVDGEVYVDLDTARERHEEFGVSFQEEALRYIAHGVLHLIGYEDDTPDKKELMHRLENQYLRAATKS